MIPQRRDLPEDGILLTLPSPPLSSVPPTLRRAELMPPDIAALMTALWNRGPLPAGQVRMALLRDVIVAEEGLVFDRDGQLFDCTVTQHADDEIARAAAAIGGDLPRHSGPRVLCKKRGGHNYGHWLIEMLPKMFLARQHLDLPGTRYVVPAAAGAIARTIANSADRIGIDAPRRLVLGSAPALFSELVVIDGLTGHGWFLSPLVLPCLDALAAVVPAGPAPRILVVRQTHRRIANWEVVRRAAETAGYAVVDPGLLPLAQQIAWFKGAREIVGIMGAAMTNIAFAAPSARIVNLAPANMPDVFFWMLAGLRSQDYTELRCRQTGPIRGPAPWDTDIIVDPDDLPHIFGHVPP